MSEDLAPSEAEPRYKAQADNAPIGIFEISKDGEVITANETVCDMLGYSQNEIHTMSVADLAPEQDDPGEILPFTEARESGPIRTEGQIRHKDGHKVDAVIKALEIEDGRLVASVNEVSTQNECETALERTRDELRQIIDLIPDPIFVKNRDDEILLSNEANADLLGATRKEVEGKPEPEFFPESEHYETLRQRDINVIESGESTVFEEDLTSIADEKHIFQTSRLPFTTSMGGEAVLGYARDITKLKEYEQELEEQRDNLEILNQVLRHDVRNDLQLISAHTELLVDRCENEELKEYLTKIQDSADHAVELTVTAREIADVTLPATQEVQRVDLRAVLEKGMSEVQSTHSNAALTYDTTIPSVEIDATEMISSVFRNLLKNAIQHNDKPLAEVSVSATEQDDIVTIRIADNGPGVPDDQKDAIFGKGERNLESAGTGIGLYLVETLVTSYGGDVWVEDNDPEGSVFVVELPTAN